MSAILAETLDAQAIRAAVAALRSAALKMLCELVSEPSLLGDEAGAQRRMTQ